MCKRCHQREREQRSLCWLCREAVTEIHRLRRLWWTEFVRECHINGGAVADLIAATLANLSAYWRPRVPGRDPNDVLTRILERRGVPDGGGRH